MIIGKKKDGDSMAGLDGDGLISESIGMQ